MQPLTSHVTVGPNLWPLLRWRTSDRLYLYVLGHRSQRCEPGSFVVLLRLDCPCVGVVGLLAETLDDETKVSKVSNACIVSRGHGGDCKETDDGCMSLMLYGACNNISQLSFELHSGESLRPPASPSQTSSRSLSLVSCICKSDCLYCQLMGSTTF